jgi:aryl-alcohol dehydrogenase-like predicted oxidoreductase
VRYRPLGTSGLQISEVGFGAWGIGGRTSGATSYGETDDAVSRRALDEAFDRGINFFDTASVYGDGRSEALIGEAFKHRRDRVVLATKAGILPSFRGYDFSAGALRASLEASLRRLGTDYVDLLQLHNAGPEVVLNQPEIGELLGRLVAEGKVRACGVSTPAPQDALALIDVPRLACFQVNCNLLDWRAIDCGLFDRALEQGVGIVARTPLAFGFLTGRLDAGTVFDAADHRSRWPREKTRAWLEAADAMHAACGSSADGPEHTELALRFCLSFAAVSTVIPGMLSPQEVAENVAASARGPLDPARLAAMEQVYRLYRARLES